jgi:hypothetical protein
VMVPVEARVLGYWCVEAARRATQWAEAALLAETMKPEPSALLGDGYAGVLASASWGDLRTSARLLDYAVRHWRVSPGEFHLLDEPERQRRRSLLRSSCLLLAASRRGRAELLSRASVERVLSYQHRCGGFFDMDPGQGHGLVELFTTAWAGRVALRMSWYERARQAAQLLAEMLYMQPDPDGRFYFVYDSASSSLVTRWREREPQARYLDSTDTAGETHQVGMALAFLAELHQAEPTGGWFRPLMGYFEVAQRWSGSLRSLPALGTVAEGLALTGMAVPDRREEVSPLLEEAIRGVVGAQESVGCFQPWDAGVGPDYDRGFSDMESTGWTAIGLTGTAHALQVWAE